MRIALVTETFLPSVDGVVTRLTHAVDWLAEHGHDLAVVAPDLGVADYHGVPVLGVPAATMPVYRSRKWGLPTPAVTRHLAAFSPDIVHVWQPDLVGLAAVEGCRRHGWPLVTSYHTDTVGYLDYYGPLRAGRRPAVWYERRLHNSAPLTLVTSRAMARTLAGRGVGRVAVLPRGVDLEARDPSFASADMRSRLTGGRPERPLVVFVGRLAPEKSLETLASVARAHPEWAFALVGDGPARAGLEEAFAGTGATFTGFLSSAELAGAFASADAFAFPSTSETLGLVILEAQASGTPVVAAQSPATAEQLSDGVNGLVYDPADAGALEAALARLLAKTDEGAELRDRLRAAGLVEAQANGWDRASAALLDAYDLALGAYSLGWRAPKHPGRARA